MLSSELLWCTEELSNSIIYYMFSIFLNRKFSFLSHTLYTSSYLGEFSITPERQYFPLVRFTLGEGKTVAFVWMQNRLSSTLFLILGLAFNERYIRHTHIKERRRHCTILTLHHRGRGLRKRRGWCVNFGESSRRWRQKLFKTAEGMRLGCVCVCVCVCTKKDSWRIYKYIERVGRKKG